MMLSLMNRREEGDHWEKGKRGMKRRGQVLGKFREVSIRMN